MLDPRTELASNHVPSFNATEHTNDCYDSWGAMNFGARPPKTTQNFENCWNWNGEGVQFGAKNMEAESGFCSPPLWKPNPPESPVNIRYRQNNYQHLSPNSRAQTISRGQWELMEMIKNMPESCYELSLKDIVEHPRLEECLGEEKNFGRQSVNQRVKVIKRQESKKNDNKAMMVRSRSRIRSIDNGGLLLKMVFPISLGSKKKKISATNTCSRVSPKPEASDKSSKAVDKEWGKRRFSVSSESECGATSSNSGSTGSGGSRGSSRSNSRRKRSGCSSGCWSFFLSRESQKTAK